MDYPIPLERLSLPEHLNGALGSNRVNDDRCQIAARNDMEAIQCWLGEYEDSPQTYRNYRKEAERLLLWGILEQQKPLSSLTREDFQDYEAFLKNPQPQERWCGPRATRFSEQWRPFLGPLTPGSQHQAMVIINALFSYLCNAGYLHGNPLSLVRRRRRHQPTPAKTLKVERFLEQDVWAFLLERLEDMPVSAIRDRQRQERLRFLLALFYLLGPRVSEVATHTMGSFKEIRGKWWWEVVGKGNKLERIPVNQAMLMALKRYREFYGHDELPSPEETTPIAMNLSGRAGITANMIYRLVKEFFQQSAIELALIDPHKAKKLQKASTHWLRHTAITHQTDAGIEMRYVNKSARHSKLETTGLYTHAEDEQWHDAMEQHRIRK